MYFGLSEEQSFFKDNVKKYLEDNASLDQIRKIASGDDANIAKEIHFDKELTIGEDTLQFLKVKKMALDGKYNVVRRKENRYPTYMTTENDQSVTKIRKNCWEWMRPLIDKINILEERNESPQPYMSLPEFIDDTYA